MWIHQLKSVKYHLFKMILGSRGCNLMQIKYRSLASLSSLIDVHPKIRDTILAKKPVVALESTIITHGMPYPQNLETALEVEEIIKSEGSTPATIAILKGRIKVGLNKDQLEELASFKNNSYNFEEKVIKSSKKDLIYAISKGISGGTTVAATLFVANKIGIKIFATGGIGGVHRNGQDTFDISADLAELGKTPIAVVCSGVKSILDIPKTLEFLETQGVFVASYQVPNCNFPAFYNRSSGCKVPYNINDNEEAARLIISLLELKLNSGVLLGVPIPEQESIPDDLINNAIEDALNKCKENKIYGKEVTPFVLEAVSNITKGKSLKANISLIKNNAKVASQIAVQLYKLLPSVIEKNKNMDEQVFFKYASNDLSTENQFSELRNGIHDKDIGKNFKIPVVIGASILDITMKVKDDFELNGATYLSETKISPGGVGRNIADGIWKQFGKVNLISAIGNDDMGRNLFSKMPQRCTKHVTKVINYPTSICNVVVDKAGECKLVLGDMNIHGEISPELISENEEILKNAPIIIMDANLTTKTMRKILEISKKHKIPVFYEPSDMRIAHKPFSLPSIFTEEIKFVSPNIFELQAISNTLKGISSNYLNISILKNKVEVIGIAKNLLYDINGYFDCVILTLGSFGVMVYGSFDMEHTFFDSNLIYKRCNAPVKLFFAEAPEVQNLVNVSGAGDSFCSGFISAMLNQNKLKNCISYGFAAAKDALSCESAVPERYTLSTENVIYEEIL